MQTPGTPSRGIPAGTWIASNGKKTPYRLGLMAPACMALLKIWSQSARERVLDAYWDKPFHETNSRVSTAQGANLAYRERGRLVEMGEHGYLLRWWRPSHLGKLAGERQGKSKSK